MPDEHIENKIKNILNDPVIKEQFDKAGESNQKIIRRAAELLTSKSDAIPALRNKLPSLINNSIEVFFSYKKKDETEAKTIVTILRDLTAGKLTITYQAEFPEDISGQAWREFIKSSINRASWFILLLPDPSDDWDWCLFETGLFEAKKTSGDRLICLHHPDKRIPEQINDYQAVSAVQDEVVGFLRMVCVKENPIFGMKPLHPKVSNIDRRAAEIVSAIREPLKKRFLQIFEPWLELDVRELRSIESIEDFDNIKIVEANDKALEIFNFMVEPKTWGELRNGLLTRPERQPWEESIFRAVQCIIEGRLFEMTQPLIEADSGKFYRPVAFAIDRLGGKGGPIQTIQIAFNESSVCGRSLQNPKAALRPCGFFALHIPLSLGNS